MNKGEAHTELQNVVDALLAGRNGLQVLDAGCGGALHIKLPADISVTGIDISLESIQRNGAIKEIILGDIQTYEFPEKSFDVVVCWEVLEHVRDPQAALSRLLYAVKENGIIVLAFPNVLSLKGLVTKLTPHWLHVWFLRNWLNDANAGRPGFAPFPTYLDWAIAPKAISSHSEKHGADIVHFRAYVGSRIVALQKNCRPAYYGYISMVKILSSLTFGRMSLSLSDIYLVLRRRSVPFDDKEPRTT